MPDSLSTNSYLTARFLRGKMELLAYPTNPAPAGMVGHSSVTPLALSKLRHHLDGLSPVFRLAVDSLKAIAQNDLNCSCFPSHTLVQTGPPGGATEGRPTSGLQTWRIFGNGQSPGDSLQAVV